MKSPITLTSQFKSSARVNDSQFAPQEFLDHFVAHGTVLRTLENLGAEFQKSAQRTFTITGPYGSGKSTLALFMTCLLSDESKVRESALKKLETAEGARASFESALWPEGEWQVVKHLCSLSSPAHEITQSLRKAAGLDVPESLHELTEKHCIEKIDEALELLSNNNDGVLIIIDELGKALDFKGRANGDLHFFQDFADSIQEYGNILVLGFLHQSFAAYAKGRDTRTQMDWGKVQGRYKDFAFNPTLEESLHLIGESFSVEKELLDRLKNNSKNTIDVVCDHLQIGNKTSLENVLPLDPVVALLLGPISKRSFSQNERSLFSFIATHEEFGFRDYIEKQLNLQENGLSFSTLYSVDHLWDYLNYNLGHVISVSGDSKWWLEACDAIDRARATKDELQVFITKLVALLSIMGQSSGLYASREFIEAYIQSLPRFKAALANADVLTKSRATAALAHLESKSIIIFRHNLNSFHIFRSSDIDINRLILEWIDRVKDGLDWAIAFQNDKLIIASAHYHRTGVMRWAQAQVVSDSEQVLIPSGKTGEAFLNYVLPTSEKLYAKLIDLHQDNPHIAIAKPYKIDLLEAASIELIALQKLKRGEGEKLSRDLIAQSEIENRETLAQLRMGRTLEEVLNGSTWVHRRHPLTGRSLTAMASQVADEIYCQCPAVQNELLNRMKVSGTSNAALNKLMMAILTEDDKQDLGLSEEGFPPEKGIYLSCLYNKGWHTPNEERTFAGKWFELIDGSSLEDNHKDAFQVWVAAFNFIKETSGMVAVSDIYAYLMSPPFGLTLGLCKLYTMAVLKSLEDHLAFYDFDSTKDWIYIPGLDEVLVGKLLRYPQEVGVRYYKLAETDHHLINQIAKASALTNQESILGVAKSLVRKVHALPSWVKRTSGNNLLGASGEAHLTSKTKRFRDQVLSAKDPYKLILNDIPGLFSDTEDLAQQLKTTLDSLSEIDPLVTQQFAMVMQTLLSVSPGEELNKRCQTVILNASRPEIEEFSRRLQRWSNEPNQAKLEDLIALAVGVRKDSWTDEKLSQGYDRLRGFCLQFMRYEAFASSAKNAPSNKTPVSLVYKAADGSLITKEHFVDPSKTMDAPTVSKLQDIKQSLVAMSSELRVKLLLDLLADEMLDVQEEN